MTGEPYLYRRHRLPGAIIGQAVWLYHLFGPLVPQVRRRIRQAIAPAQTAAW